MKIEIEIPDQDIIDVLTTALEGGSNYWYWIKELPKDLNKEFSTSESICKYVLAHPENKIMISDVETDEELGYLCKDNIRTGISLFTSAGDPSEAVKEDCYYYAGINKQSILDVINLIEESYGS